MFENLPPSLAWIGTVVVGVLSLFLGSKVIAVIVERWFGREKTEAETMALNIANLQNALAALKTESEKVQQQSREIDGYVQTIRELKDAKIEDDRKISGQRAVIEEQRIEIRTLHEEIAAMRLEIRDLTVRVDTMERENRELMKENLQLKGMEENAARITDDGA